MNNMDNFYLDGEISPFSYNKSTIEAPIIGSITVNEEEEVTYISILINNSNGDWDDAEKIGQVIHSVDFANYVKNYPSINDGIKVQFILEKEKPKKKLKTLKSMKRKLILKRMIKLKPLYYWKNIVWKYLESLKSLLK